MGIVIRLLLIAASLSTTLYILKRIRHAKLQIEYAIFWLLFAGILLIISGSKLLARKSNILF